MSRVVEYKVKKAIDDGHSLNEESLAKVIGRTVEDVRAALINLYPEKIDTIAPPSQVVRKTATFEELVEYARPIFMNDGIQGILEYEYFPHACCCMGPIDNAPLCPCAMDLALAQNKNTIALELARQYKYIHAKFS